MAQDTGWIPIKFGAQDWKNPKDANSLSKTDLQKLQAVHFYQRERDGGSIQQKSTVALTNGEEDWNRSSQVPGFTARIHIQTAGSDSQLVKEQFEGNGQDTIINRSLRDMQGTAPEQLELGSDKLHQLNGMTISNSVLNFNMLKMEI